MLRHFFVFFAPAFWVVVDAINFRYPGDEYGGWAVGSLPGLWILLIIGDAGDTSRLLPYVLAAGGATMAALGWAMDWLRTPPIAWAVLAALIATALTIYSLAQYPSWERAIAKNGSVEAYIFPAVSLGLMGSTIAMIAAMGLTRVWRRLRRSGTKNTKLGLLDV